MATKTITITVVAGVPRVSTDRLRVKPANSDKLCFTCNHGDFAVLFKNRSPYDSGKKTHSEHKGKTTTALKIRKLTSAEQGFPEDDDVNGATFRYGVAVMDSATGHILTLDPDIIIDDPSGGGGGGTIKKSTKGKAAKKK